MSVCFFVLLSFLLLLACCAVPIALCVTIFCGSLISFCFVGVYAHDSSFVLTRVVVVVVAAVVVVVVVAVVVVVVAAVIVVVVVCSLGRRYAEYCLHCCQNKYTVFLAIIELYPSALTKIRPIPAAHLIRLIHAH